MARAGEWERAVVHGHVPEHPTPQATGTEYFSLDVEDVPAAESRPDRLAGVRPQERVQQHFVDQFVDTAPVLPILDVPCAADKLSENIRVKRAHDGTGQPVEQNSSSAHTVKEQFAPEENRDIASFNTDNEFNRAIHEEDIDFNIPGLPHSAVKRSHGVNVQNLIQKIENHSQRRALQSDLQQHRQFNPFSKESRDVIKAAGNTELCELLDVEPKAQCKVCLSYWDVGKVNCTCGHFLRGGKEENKKYLKFTLDLFFDSQLLHQERATPRPPLREETSTSSRTRSRRNARREISWVFTIGSSVMKDSERP